MPFDNIKRRLKPMPSLDEVEALSAPSIMDEYIKQNDPEQFANIEQAKNIQMALDSASGIGGAMGTIKNIAPKITAIVPREELMKRPNMDSYIKSMKENVDPNFDIMNDVSYLNHNAPDYDQVYAEILKRLKK